MPTLAELDEALGHARQVPAEQRGSAWYAYVDRLLEQRAQIDNTTPIFAEAT
jgi:hypothetical protein